MPRAQKTIKNMYKKNNIYIKQQITFKSKKSQSEQPQLSRSASRKHSSREETMLKYWHKTTNWEPYTEVNEYGDSQQATDNITRPLPRLGNNKYIKAPKTSSVCKRTRNKCAVNSNHAYNKLTLHRAHSTLANPFVVLFHVGHQHSGGLGIRRAVWVGVRKQRLNGRQQRRHGVRR